jgi:ketosteroid isomerase-like protein
MRPDPKAFAEEWIAAWNAHDLEAVLSHYAEDIVFVSPNSTRYTGDPTGRVAGKAALREYWGKALTVAGLHFTLKGVYAGPDGVAIRYFSSRTNAEAVEVVRFDDDGLVRDSAAFYE